MKNLKLTPWFHGNIKPVRIGTYERDYYVGKLAYCYWDGRRFGIACRFFTDTSPLDKPSVTQSLPWRGVAK